jgi:uncharacterized protein DUF4262
MKKSVKQVLTAVRSTVARCGQAVIGIIDDDGLNTFHYTVGRGKRGLPELLITALLHPEAARAILNDLDGLMPEPVTSGTLIICTDGTFPIMVIDAEDPCAKKNYTKVATAFHGGKNKYRVQQIVICDETGRFPPDCSLDYAAQPLLGSVMRLH